MASTMIQTLKKEIASILPNLFCRIKIENNSEFNLWYQQNLIPKHQEWGWETFCKGSNSKCLGFSGCIIPETASDGLVTVRNLAIGKSNMNSFISLCVNRTSCMVTSLISWLNLLYLSFFGKHFAISIASDISSFQSVQLSWIPFPAQFKSPCLFALPTYRLAVSMFARYLLPSSDSWLSVIQSCHVISHSLFGEMTYTCKVTFFSLCYLHNVWAMCDSFTTALTWVYCAYEYVLPNYVLLFPDHGHCRISSI